MTSMNGKSLVLCVISSFFLLACFQSCVSTNSFENDVMFCMIYDYENKGVMAASVFLNDKFVCYSDSSGRCILPKIKDGKSTSADENSSNGKRNFARTKDSGNSVLRADEIKIRIEKKGFETIESYFVFDPMNVLYFKVGSKEQLMYSCEKALDSSDYQNAVFYAKKATSCEKDLDALYLYAIALNKAGQLSKSDEVLDELFKISSQKENAEIAKFALALKNVKPPHQKDDVDMYFSHESKSAQSN